MNISGITERAYIYNNNKVSSASLNKISRIVNRVEKGNFDFSQLSVSKNTENTNPLKMGESKNFTEIVEAQFAASQANAARIMQPSI